MFFCYAARILKEISGRFVLSPRLYSKCNPLFGSREGRSCGANIGYRQDSKTYSQPRQPRLATPSMPSTLPAPADTTYVTVSCLPVPDETPDGMS